MMHRLPKGLLVLLAVLALVAGACSSESGNTDEPVGGTDTAGVTATTGVSAETPTTTTGGGGDSTAADEIVLNLWTFGNMGFDTVIAEWEAQNPGVKVEQKVAGYDEHHEALLTALASGEVPEIAAVEVGYSSMFLAVPDKFVDLNTLGAADIAGNYLPWRWEQGVAADGRVIGIPTDVGGMAIAYRTDLFAAAGLPTDRDEVSALWPTWDDFIAVGKRYVAGSGGQAFIDSGGTFYQAVLNQGTEKYYTTPDANGDTTLIYETSPQNLKAWDLSVQAIDAGLSAAYANFSPEWNAAMANGDFAVLMAPAWMLGYIQGQAPDTAGLWDIAAMPEGGGNWGGSQLTIPAGSKHQDLSWSLISYILDADSQLSVFKEFGNFPSIPALYDSEAIQSFTNPFFDDAPVGPIYAASAESLSPIYEGPQERAISREFGNGLNRIEQGLEDPPTAWKTTIEAIKLEVGS